MNRGFTLMELLVVIAIIGILSSVVMASLSGARAKARDSERITEIAQLQLALELYYNNCKQYPSTLATSANNGCPSGVDFSTFIGNSVPTDPQGNDYGYTYGTDYLLGAQLERDNKVLLDDIDSGTAGALSCADNLVYCVNGQ